MGSQFTVCLLTQGRRSAPDFLLASVNLRPGQAVSPHSQENVLLAGGFASLTPDTAFPLSPTLQLNLDLAGAGKERLHRLALAELARLRSLYIPTYRVHPDPRLWLIGRDGDRLRQWCETYGGLLDIHPLLAGGQDPDFVAIANLQLGRDGEHLRLDYTICDPIDRSRCRYCGNCGSVCPSGCIDEMLHVDLANCSDCGMCVKACPAQAIDFRGRAAGAEAPALLVMEGVEVALPDDRRDIYSEGDWPAFLASQSILEVEEAIAWQSDCCQFDPVLAVGCRRCVDICPYGAVRCDREGIAIDARHCRECGSCVSACPTGALQYRRWPDEAFVEYLSAIEPMAETTVVLGSERTLQRLWWRRPAVAADTFFLEWPQPGTLSLFHFVALLLAGATRIIVFAEPGSAGSTGPMVSHAARCNSLFAAWFGVATDLVAVTHPDDLCALAAPPTQRRWPLNSGPLAGDRRQRLAALLRLLAESGGASAPSLADPIGGFSTLACDEKRCTLCLGCLRVCRTGALAADSTMTRLSWQGILCVGCGGCAMVCPEQALALTAGAALDLPFFRPQPLAATEPMICSCCGRPFGSRKSYERVSDFMRQRGMASDEALERCEACRVTWRLEVN